MRLPSLVLALFLGLAMPVSAQDAPEAVIKDVIQSQIDAFLNNDFATAFTFASPSIKSMFGTPDRFGTMVRNGYPMVWRPAEVQFLDLREIDGALWQAVMLRDAGGRLHVLGYQMEQQPDGSWKIDGVQILREPQVGA